jgi:hypothetical protein
MSFSSPDIPEPPPPTPPPDTGPAAAAAENERRASRARKGRSANELTSPLGAADYGDLGKGAGTRTLGGGSTAS